MNIEQRYVEIVADSQSHILSVLQVAMERRPVSP